MNYWSWMLWGILIAGGISVHAQDSVIPSDDRKEPKTLISLVEKATAARPAAGEETSYRAETNYQAGPATPTPTPTPLPLKAGTVDKVVENVRVRGYQAAPAKVQPKGAILMLHEWWGLNAALRREADEWARRGFKVLAVDLYDGEVAGTRAGAARLMAQLKPEKTLPKLKAALTLLTEPEKDKALKIGVVGFGLGANQALRLVADDGRPVATVIFYGDPPKDPEQVRKIQTPLLGFFTSRDPLVTPEKVEAFKKALSGAKIPPQTFTYVAFPGFMFNQVDSISKTYADTARQKTQEFLTRQLEP